MRNADWYNEGEKSFSLRSKSCYLYASLWANENGDWSLYVPEQVLIHFQASCERVALHNAVQIIRFMGVYNE